MLLRNRFPLDLETSRRSPATSLLELPPLALHVWLLMAVWSKSKVFDCLPSVLWSAQQQCVGTCRSSQGQLIDCQALSTSLLNSSACRGGKSQGSNVKFGDGEEAVVICDGADYDYGLVLVSLCGGPGCSFRDDAGDGHWRAVDAGHEETAEDNLVEVRVCATGKKAVKLHQKLEVDIFAFGSLSMATPNVMAIEIDT